MNKDKAMQMLKAKLYLVKQEENAAKEAGIRGEVKEIGWGKMCIRDRSSYCKSSCQ